MSKKINNSGKPVIKHGSQWINYDVKVNTGLPPQVGGQIRCFCKLTVSQIVWLISKPPDLALIRVKWWGEEGSGIYFRPQDVKKVNKKDCKTTARYPVRSGPIQFATYLTDMDKLTLDLMNSPDSEIIGQAHVTQIGLLSNSRPINGLFPVLSPTGQKLANLQVSLVLEPIIASYDDHGVIPTTDVVNDYHKEALSKIVPEGSYSSQQNDVPSKPVNTVLESPKANVQKSQRELKTFSNQSLQVNHSSKQTVSIATNGDAKNVSDSLPFQSHINSSFIPQGNSSTKVLSTGGRDLLSVLVNKGTKLREAMIVSSMHTDLNPGHVTVVPDIKSCEASIPGLATAGYMADDQTNTSRSAVDLLMMSPIKNHDFQFYRMLNGQSPGTTVSSDMDYDVMMSELEDPMHDNSILQDLFYYHSDTDLGLSDISGLDLSLKHNNKVDHYISMPNRLLGGAARRHSLEEPGNQRPLSRASSLVSLNTAIQDEEVVQTKMGKGRRKARSRSRSLSSSRSGSRSRSNSRTRKRSNVLASSKPQLDMKENNLPKPVKPKKKIIPRSRSSSRSRSRSRKRKVGAEEVSDSDQMSVAQSETSRVSFDTAVTDSKLTRTDGMSVERLTLLGRVHVARVSIDHLQLIKPDNPDLSSSKLSVSKLTIGAKPPKPNKTKKPCTYFVEYQFPVVASLRDKYDTSAMATEVTRVASKNVKNGAIMFNHRSVFPVIFDGAVVERWWKSALVFRVYCKEAGEQPTLVGSGGISLKSILRSENLFVQRNIEIPDTSKTGLLNVSRSSLSSSLNNRNTTHLFGHLKVSVELASDFKEFATVMARTRLAEMSGNVKIVPIGGPSAEQVKLIEQLNRNKDQPQVRVLPKVGLQNAAAPQPSASNAVTSLPPQSPRRRSQLEDEGDEISKLKQQLKATLEVLGNTVQQQKDKELFTGHGGGTEPLTLHTLLFVQEGKNLSLTGELPPHKANKHPSVIRLPTEGKDSVMRNTYLVCRLFWCNDAVHSDVCWGTLDPEYNFLQVVPVMLTPQLLERMRDNYIIIEVWDKKLGSESDKLIGIVKLSLHQFYMSFREKKIANALLKSEYPVMAIDNYMPIVDPFTGYHFGQLKVILAMGYESQIATLQRLALPSSGMHTGPQKLLSYMERQDLITADSVVIPNKAVEHQFEITIEGIRDLKLFEKMMWGEADCFVQFFFPTESAGKDDGIVTLKSLPTMKCFRTATTLCTPDPTFHDTSRHKITLPFGTPVQRELLTACANSGGSVTGLPFEVWCRYYHPNVRDQLIAKSLLPLGKLCAMITMHQAGEPCVQSFSLRLTQVGVDGQQENVEAAAKSKSVGVLDVTLNYKALSVQINSSATVDRNYNSSQVCLSIGVVRASGLKAAADYIALIDPSMAYPADVGVNCYVRIKISFLGKENERITKTVARSFAPEFSHYMDFPCPLLLSSSVSTDATSLAELLETGEVVFEVWHQIPTGIHREYQQDKGRGGLRQLIHQTGDILLGTAIVPLAPLLTRRKGVTGWFAINLPTLGWIKPLDEEMYPSNALDQVVGGLDLCLKFAHQEDRDHVVNAARSVGWSPVDVDVDQMDWQDEDSHHNVHHITVSVDQVSFPLTSALLTGHTDLDPEARCYIRYTFYDQGAVVSKCGTLSRSQSGSLLTTLNHKQVFKFSHSAPLQWYLREERLEIQAWIIYNSRQAEDNEKKPRQRDKLVGCCYLDLESLTDLRRGQQRISGLFPIFKPGCSNLKSAFIRAHVTSKVASSSRNLASKPERKNKHLDTSVSASETDPSDSLYDELDKSPVSKGLRRDPATSFAVLLAIERAMHLPMVTERNRSGEVCPSTYVSYQSAERNKPTCSPIFPNSTNPVWDYAVETRLSTEYLFKENKNLVLKVWHKPSDASKSPDKSTDRVLGFVSIDLSSLNKGLHQICGWYNIIDFNGQCRGQIKVSITPHDQAGMGLSHATPSSSFIFPSISLPGHSMTTSDVTSVIAQQLQSLQQQVIHRMTTLSAAAVSSGQVKKVDTPEDMELSNTFNWRPQFTSEIKTNDDPSKSYLESSLKRQLQELDTMTQRLKSRLVNQTSDLDTSMQQLNSARSGDILTGTKSSLSTIHPLSSFSDTRESSTQGTFDDVATSQESAHSRTLNNSSVVEAGVPEGKAEDKSGGILGRKLLDSGIYSARNFSEKSGGEDAPDSHRSDRNVSTSDNMSTLRSAYNDTIIAPESAAIGTLEGGYLSGAAGKTQTLLPHVDNSESSGNSHGFTPGTYRSNATESFSVKVSDKLNTDSKAPSASVSSKSKSQSGSSTARSEQYTARGNERQDDEDDDNDENEDNDEDDDELNGKYGNYQRYRELLDAEEEDEAENKSDEEEAEVVEIIPKSLNNMSTVLALNSANGATPGKKDGESLAAHQAIDVSSPNCNAHDGTSIWCSDDNDSFFQQVFEKNEHVLIDAVDAVEDDAIDGWLNDQANQLDKARLESWLEAHDQDKKILAQEESKSVEEGEDEDSEDKTATHDDQHISIHEKEDMRLKLHDISAHENDEETARSTGRKNHVWRVDAVDSSEEETSRGMWVKRQSADDFFPQDDDLTRLDMSGSRINKEKPSAPEPKNLLSLVELTSTVESSAQGNNLLSAAPMSQTLQSTFSSASAPSSQTLLSTFSEISTLATNQRTLQDYPFTLELADSTQPSENMSPGRVKHLLSNVELDSNSSSPRPHSYQSKSSPRSKLSQKSHSSKASSKTSKYASSDSRKSGHCRESDKHLQKSKGSYPDLGESNSKIVSNGDNVDECNGQLIDASNTSDNEEENQLDLKYSNKISSNVVLINGLHQAEEESSQGHKVNGTALGHHSQLPNFFMPDEDMQASILALKMATSAASKISQEDVRANNKVKAVSELVSKMAAPKSSAASLSMKAKGPPSAEEAKRIAKIFSSKFSSV